MSYHTTIFRQILAVFSRLEFQNIVDQYNGDYRVRQVKCWDQFMAMLYSQLSSRSSLRETVDTMNTQQNKLYHLGTKSISRSTLSDANNTRDYRIYQDFFFMLLDRVQRHAPKYKLRLDRKFYMLDMTTIDLCLKLFPWARFRKAKGGVRLHTLFDADGSLPVFTEITDGKVHELTAVKKIPVPSGSYLVFDKGYHDFKYYKQLTNNDIRFVTRLKTNAAYTVIEMRQPDAATGIITDETVVFAGPVTQTKYQKPLRIIRYFDKDSDKTLEFLTNDFDLEACTVTQVYKARWEIELFFKTIKQNLKIKRFIGYSFNAVSTQIWIALITYLLVSYFKFTNSVNASVQTLFRRIQVNLFERKSLSEILRTSNRKTQNKGKSPQLAFI